MTLYSVAAGSTMCGLYQASDRRGAIEACAIDAGYTSIEHAADAVGQTVAEFLADWDAVEQRPFLQSSDDRETSPELIAAIWEVARHNEIMAERLWADPSPREVEAIKARVVDAGHDPADLVWGASRHDWQ